MIIVDVETTGIDPEKHSIVSIGAVDFSNPSNEFYIECQPWDGAEITDRALEINGFTRDQLFDVSKGTLSYAIAEFVEWANKIGDYTMGGQNVGKFDLMFSQSSVNRSELDFDFGRRSRDLHTTTSDTMDRLGMKIPLKNGKSDLNLDNILRFVGLAPEPKPHNALTGAKLEAEAYSRLLFGESLLPEYREFELPEYLKKL